MTPKAEITFAAPMYAASVPQKHYATLLMDPTAPSELADLATTVGVTPADLRAWHDSPGFRQWLNWELERLGQMQVPLIWREVLRIATQDRDPKTKLEALRLYAGRFDTGARVMGMGVQKAGEQVGKELAKAVATKLADRTVRTVAKVVG